MSRYTEIRSFVLVAERGSFAAAAVVEGVTPVVLGRRLDALEKRLGVKLMHRSTRGLVLTDLGEQFLEQCKLLLHDFALAEASISDQHNTMRGRLVVSAPAAFGRKHVAPHVLAFKQRYPELHLTFNFTDSVIDLVNEGYDMGIRVGAVYDPNYVAVRLYPNQRVVCGTPAYFEKQGIPQTPEDLVHHNCLAFNLQGGQQHGWTFIRNGRVFSVRVQGDLDSNEGELLYDCVKKGWGVGWRSTWEIQAELQKGELITVLDDYAIPDYDIQAVYQQQRYVPAKVRVFTAYLKDIYNQPGYWQG
ncbi:LysR family transcriptional regulator [Paenalcaligenes hominis]|uniref:LysR family transcriptional regulator n=1 Tax=Paenalcaligenes hominis TaxID=643674 RepID=UPI003524244A